MNVISPVLSLSVLCYIMAEFTIAECTNMINIYGKTRGNGRVALRIYANCFAMVIAATTKNFWKNWITRVKSLNPIICPLVTNIFNSCISFNLLPQKGRNTSQLVPSTRTIRVLHFCIIIAPFRFLMFFVKNSRKLIEEHLRKFSLEYSILSTQIGSRQDLYLSPFENPSSTSSTKSLSLSTMVSAPTLYFSTWKRHLTKSDI